MAGAEDVVRSFCKAVSRRDASLVRALLTADVVYHNVGMPAANGVDDVVASIEGQWQMFSGAYEFRVLNIASAGDVVLTERVDVIGPEGRACPVPVMGAFEVRDGGIARWRDYFDMALVAKMMSGEDVSTLVP